MKTSITHSIQDRKFRMLLKITFVAFSILLAGDILAQCPTPCTTHTMSANSVDFPTCASGMTASIVGNIDNNSDCEDPNGDNCYEFVITRHDPSLIGFVADIGTGAGCNGEADIFYTLVDGVCKTYASAGSQNNFHFVFGVSDELRVYICDNSSGQVSICGLCLTCPPPTATIEVSEIITRNN